MKYKGLPYTYPHHIPSATGNGHAYLALIDGKEIPILITQWLRDGRYVGGCFIIKNDNSGRILSRNLFPENFEPETNEDVHNYVKKNITDKEFRKVYKSLQELP